MADLFLLLNNNTDGIDLSFLKGHLSRQASFARASTAEVFNSGGMLAQVAAGIPRFDYNPSTLAPRGLLIERQRTNSIIRSNSLTMAPWGSFSKVTVTPNAGISPDGTLNATSVTGTGSASFFAQNLSLSANTTYTLSFWVKNVSGSSDAAFKIFDGANYYNLGFGMHANWTRVSLVLTTTSVVSGAYIFFGDAVASGWSANLIYGLQLEAGSSSTSYIPTTSTAATRAADVLSFTVPNGVNKLRYVFDDNSTQDVSVSAGTYTVPTNLNRAWIKRVYSF